MKYGVNIRFLLSASELSLRTAARGVVLGKYAVHLGHGVGARQVQVLFTRPFSSYCSLIGRGNCTLVPHIIRGIYDAICDMGRFNSSPVSQLE